MMSVFMLIQVWAERFNEVNEAKIWAIQIFSLQFLQRIGTQRYNKIHQSHPQTQLSPSL